MSIIVRATAAAAVLVAFFFAFADAADIDLVVAKDAGGLMATSTGQSSSVFFKFRSTGCLGDKVEPCLIFEQVQTGMTVSASAPDDCRVDTNGREIATVYCRAADYASVVIVKNNGGVVSLASGPRNHSLCAPVPVTVTIRATGSVDSQNGCASQTITCAPNSFAGITANVGDAVTGPCLSVVRK